MGLKEGDLVIIDRLPAAPLKYDQQNEQKFRRILELTRFQGGGDTAALDVDAPIFEAFDRSGTQSASGIALSPYGSFRNAATTNPFWVLTGGSGHPFAVHSSVALPLRKSSTNDGAYIATPAWPVYSDLATVLTSLTHADPYMYTFECFVTRHAATAEIGIRNGVSNLASASTVMGVMARDNAGNWEVAQRLTSGGAITTPSPNFTVTSTDWHHLKILYYEYSDDVADAKLEFYFDGVLWYSITGVANLPATPASASTQYGPAVGDNVLTSFAHLRVDSIAALAAANAAASAAITTTREPIQTVAVDYSMLTTDGTVLVNAAGGAVTIDLPLASSMVGRTLMVKKIDASANSVTVDAGASTIDGSTTKSTTTQWASFRMICNGTSWYLIL